MAPWFKELTGIEGSKPFECVGTIDESKLAVGLAIRQYQHADESIPHILHDIVRMIPQGDKAIAPLEEKILSAWNKEHFLPEEYENVLKKFL